MSDMLGSLTFGKKNEEIFLGREIATHRDYSEDTAQAIDEEVRRIVNDAEKRADKILRDHLDDLKLLSKTLLEYEVMDGDEINELIKNRKLIKQNNKKITKPKKTKKTTPKKAASARPTKKATEKSATKKVSKESDPDKGNS